MDKSVEEFTSLDSLSCKRRNDMEVISNAVLLSGGSKYKIFLETISVLLNEVKSKLDLISKLSISRKDISFQLCESMSELRLLAEHTDNLNKIGSDSSNANNEEIQESLLSNNANDLSVPRTSVSEKKSRSFTDSFSNMDDCSIEKSPLKPLYGKRLFLTDNENSFKQIQFLDSQEFTYIPSYMRGRMSVSEVNNFITNINDTLKKKYEFLNRPRTTTNKPGDIQLRNAYKADECEETFGHCFITDNNLMASMGIKTLTKKMCNMVTMLRHTKRIKEIRVQSVLRYIIL